MARNSVFLTKLAKLLILAFCVMFHSLVAHEISANLCEVSWKPVHIVVLVGSLRKSSTNAGLARVIASKVSHGNTVDLIVPGKFYVKVNHTYWCYSVVTYH